MSLSDCDLEQLESHLDGELSVADDEALRERMNIEPELAAVLETLRADRDARRGAFLTMEPDDAAVERFNRLASREIQRVDRESFWRNTASRLRVVAAAAACLVIGFSVARISDSGVLNRGPRATIGALDPSSPAVEVILTDSQGRQLGVQRFTSQERAQQFVTDCKRWQEQQERGLNEIPVTPVSQPAEQF
jgi:anti-sigma factor RsiW